jgi:predicted metal-binding membrane protein
VVAAIYELTPLKDVCLGKCRSPLGFLLGSWRDGVGGSLRMGLKNGAWCVGCCWALMAALFALGVMSVLWMAVVAGVIAFQKTIPWARAASFGAAGLLAALAGFMLLAPDALPWLTTGSSSMGM